MFGKNGIFRAAPGTHNGVAMAPVYLVFLVGFILSLYKYLKDK